MDVSHYDRNRKCYDATNKLLGRCQDDLHRKMTTDFSWSYTQTKSNAFRFIVKTKKRRKRKTFQNKRLKHKLNWNKYLDKLKYNKCDAVRFLSAKEIKKNHICEAKLNKL